MRFYSNGVIIEGYKFYEYNSKNGLEFITDILEGYFPYEIKKNYPDGVIFNIVDHTEEVYKEMKLKYVMMPMHENTNNKSNNIIEIDTLKSREAFNDEEITLIKVRTEDGKNTLSLKVLAGDNIEVIYKCVEQYRYLFFSIISSSNFTLKRAFPQEEFKRDSNKPLKELGLCPSAVLVMHQPFTH